MEVSFWMVALVCGGVFLGGLVDAMAGGGGLITLPVYFLTGMPAHMAIATNKVSSTCGNAASAVRYAKNGCVQWRLVPAGIVAAGIGAALGAQLVLLVDDAALRFVMVFLLPVVAVAVLRDKSMEAPAGQRSPLRTAATLLLLLAVGVYDGFYGPGGGTFYLLVLTKAGRLDVRSASGTMKWINLSSSLTSMVVFLINGQVIVWLGLLAGAFSLVGHYVGSGLVLRRGAKIVRPVVLVVLAGLFVKIIVDFL